MNNKGRFCHNTLPYRRTIRRSLIVLVAAAAAASVGVGVAAAAGGSARDHALSQAQAIDSNWPTAKAKLYESEVRDAFPSQPPAKPRTTGQRHEPAPAPGVPETAVPDARNPGVSDLRQAPFASSSFAATGSYSQMVSGRWYVLYAGTVGGQSSDTGLGGVRVLSADATSNKDVTDLGTFPAPGTTKLTISSGSGASVTLLTETGARLTFDLTTLSYQ